MAVSAIFTKLKSFSPAIVVGSAVAITIKLLTTQTPTIQESFSVNAIEDITTISYKDEIKEPEPEVPPPPETQEEKGEEENPVEEQETKEVEENQESASEEALEPKKEEKQKSDQEKRTSRQWKPNSKNPVVNILKRLTEKKK